MLLRCEGMHEFQSASDTINNPTSSQEGPALMIGATHVSV